VEHLAVITKVHSWRWPRMPSGRNVMRPNSRPARRFASYHGDAFIHRVEVEAKQNSRFNLLLRRIAKHYACNMFGRACKHAALEHGDVAA
jgi:hypothetical protein